LPPGLQAVELAHLVGELAGLAQVREHLAASDHLCEENGDKKAKDGKEEKETERNKKKDETWRSGWNTRRR